MSAKRNSKNKATCTADETATEYKIVRKRVASLKPSPENLNLYRAIDPDDPEIVKLADSIRSNGLHDPLVVTKDKFIVSGHRRHAALLIIGQSYAPCRVLNILWGSLSPDERIAVLRDHNRQRYKNVVEQVREELVDINSDEAYQNLIELRDKSVWHFEDQHVQSLEIEGTKHRPAISEDKSEHVKYVKQVVFNDTATHCFKMLSSTVLDLSFADV